MLSHIDIDCDGSKAEKGIAKVGSEMRKLQKEAQLTQKGVNEMFQGDEFAAAAGKFSNIQAAVEKYIKTMSRSTTVKQELKATTQVATELEAAWRKMSDAEKQSAEGQAVRANIDALIEKAGNLRDTMGDVSGAIQKVASDTRGLDVAVQGLSVLSATAQVAAGAFTAMGVEQSKVAEIQQKLTSLIAITNGLQTIQNALQKESALMMKLSQVAAQGLNATIKANPIGALCTVLVAAGAALYEFALKAKVADEAQHALSEEIKSASGNYADNRARLARLVDEWKNLTNAMQRNQFIKDNQEEFSKLGVEVNNVGDAENLLVNNTNTFIDAMKHRARAAAYAALAVKAFQEEIEATEAGNDRMKNQTTSDRVWGFLNMDWSFDMDESIRREQRMGANAYYHQAGTARSRAEEYLRKSQEEQDAANAGFRSGGFRSHTKAGKTGGGKHTSTTKTPKPDKTPTVEGSIEWYNEEIAMLEDALKQINITQFPEAFADVTKRIKTLKEELSWKQDRANGVPLVDVMKGVAKATDLVKVKTLDVSKMAVPKLNEGLETLEERLRKITDTGRAVASVFTNMGNAVGGQAGDWLKWGGTVITSCTQAYTALAKVIPALQGKAISEAAAGAATAGPLGWLNAIAAVAAMVASFASIPKFANGGIIGGNDHSDGILARVSSGEMILNQGQQRNLFNMINGGGARQVEFVIRGRDLVGVERNYSSKMGKL